jgi:flagellar protein FlaF
MGFSVSGATAVILVGVLVCAATLYPAVDRYEERRSDAVADRNERALTQQNTAVETLNATYNATSDRLNVTVWNTGTSVLSVPELDLLVDGTHTSVAANDVTVSGDTTTEVWVPNERLSITVTESTTPEQVTVVTGPGVATTTTVEVV